MLRMRREAALLGAMGLAVSSSASAGPTATFEVLAPSASIYDRLAIATDGSAVVGTRPVSGGTEAFLWTRAGGVVGLGDLDGGTLGSSAGAVTPNGAVVVGTSENGSIDFEAFRWTASGGMVGLGVLSQSASTPMSNAQAVTDDGAAVFGISPTSLGFQHAFMWSAGAGMQSLPDLGGDANARVFDVSAAGDVAAGAGDPGPSQFFAPTSTPARWMLDAAPTIDGVLIESGETYGEFGEAYGVSPDGAVLVGVLSPPDAFVWSEAGGRVKLPDLDGAAPGAVALHEPRRASAGGEVLVGVVDVDTRRAAVWFDLGAPRLLQDVLEDDHGVDLTGWTLVTADDVSADGTAIVGTARNPSGDLVGYLVRFLEPADLNGDGVVDGADLGLLLGEWGACQGCGGDLNGDGAVDGADLGLLLGAWS